MVLFGLVRSSFWIAFMVCFLFVCRVRTDCGSKEMKSNFGETSKITCGKSDTLTSVAWFKNGKRISKTPKTAIFSGNLYIYCLESSDNGVYMCKDKVNSTEICSYILTVKNQENRTYFHIYNQYHQECVSRRGMQLLISPCDLNQCSQKWSWSGSQQIISGLDYANLYCISVNQLVNKENVVLDSCNSSNLFQKWECKDYDLLTIQGQKLYFNYGNTGTDIVLFTGSGSWSRWVKYSTGGHLCDKDCCSKAITLNFGGTSKMACGVSNSSREVAWYKNGREVSNYTSKREIISGYLNIFCLEPSDSGDYVCKDRMTSTNIDSHYLNVKNPEYRKFFHIYNVYHGMCVSRIGKQLFVDSCDLNQCSQKWSWSPSSQIISALDDKNPECISVDHFLNKKIIVMDPCNSSMSFQKWECKDGNLLSIHGEELYFNYGNTGTDIVIYTGNGAWSRWVKYIRHESLCNRGKPSAKITCPQEVTLRENDTFTCWCKAVQVNSSPTVTWIKNGRVLGVPSNIGQLLNLRHVNNEASGIYVCRAQLYQLIEEEMIMITVQYAPRIISFYGTFSGNNSLTITCRAEGLPKPTYKVFADDIEVKKAINGMVIVHDNIENNKTIYKCIAKNILGQSTRRFSRISLSPLKVLTCQSKLQKSATSVKNERSLHFIFIAAFAGFFVGIILVLGLQWLWRRKRNDKVEQPQTTAENPCYKSFTNTEQGSTEQLTLDNITEI